MLYLSGVGLHSVMLSFLAGWDVYHCRTSLIMLSLCISFCGGVECWVDSFFEDLEGKNGECEATLFGS